MSGADDTRRPIAGLDALGPEDLLEILRGLAGEWSMVMTALGLTADDEPEKAVAVVEDLRSKLESLRSQVDVAAKVLVESANTSERLRVQLREATEQRRRIRRTLVDEATAWGEEHGVDVAQLLFRMRTAPVPGEE